jgi:hypothetical protein
VIPSRTSLAAVHLSPQAMGPHGLWAEVAGGDHMERLEQRTATAMPEDAAGVTRQRKWASAPSTNGWDGRCARCALGPMFSPAHPASVGAALGRWRRGAAHACMGPPCHRDPPGGDDPEPVGGLPWRRPRAAGPTSATTRTILRPADRPPRGARVQGQHETGHV